MKNYELLEIFIICYFVAIPIIFLVVWNENVNQWIPKNQRQTFFEFIIEPSDNLKFSGNILFYIIKTWSYSINCNISNIKIYIYKIKRKYK